MHSFTTAASDLEIHNFSGNAFEVLNTIFYYETIINKPSN